MGLQQAFATVIDQFRRRTGIGSEAVMYNVSLFIPVKLEISIFCVSPPSVRE